MRLTFLLRRRSTIKVLGSTMDAAQRRGHAIALCLREEAKEPFQLGDFDRWPFPRVRQLCGLIIGLATDPLADIGVSSWMDNTLKPYNQGAWVQCYLSEWHKALHAECWPQSRAVIAHQPIVGWTMADHRALIAALPRYHLLFTLKRRVPEPWRRSLRGRAWYFKKVYGAWHAAKEAGLPLVIKTRPKHGDPWWLGRFGHVIGEDSMYPATSLQLLASAQQATHFMSGAHAEACLMGVPVLNHTLPQPHLDKFPGQQAIYQQMVHEPMSRKEYVEKFFTYDDCHAGERVMDVVEAQ